MGFWESIGYASQAPSALLLGGTGTDNTPESSGETTGVDLNGVDIIVAVTEKALNAQYATLYSKQVIHGNVVGHLDQWQVSNPKATGIVLQGTLAAPRVSFAVKGQRNMVAMTFVLTSGSFGFYDGFGPTATLVGGTFDQFSYTFYVNMNMAALSADYLKLHQQPGSPRPVFMDYMDGPTAELFTPQYLFMDMENLDLAHYEPDLSSFQGWKPQPGAGEKPLDNLAALKQIQGLLENYFTSLQGTANPFVLGYAIPAKQADAQNQPTTPATEKVPNAWQPTSASFSTYDYPATSDLNTLNMLMDTGGRMVGANDGLIQAALATTTDHEGVMAISNTLFLGQFVYPALRAILESYRDFLTSIGSWYVGDVQVYLEAASKANEISTALGDGTWTDKFWPRTGFTYSLSIAIDNRGQHSGKGQIVGSDSKMVDIYEYWTLSMGATLSLTSSPDYTTITVTSSGNINLQADTYEYPASVQMHDSSLTAKADFNFTNILKRDDSGTLTSTYSGLTKNTPDPTPWTNPLQKIGDVFGGNVQSWTKDLATSLETLETQALDEIGDGLARSMNQVRQRVALPYGSVFKFGIIWLDANLNLLTTMDWQESASA